MEVDGEREREREGELGDEFFKTSRYLRVKLSFRKTVASFMFCQLRRGMFYADADYGCSMRFPW